MSTCLLLRFQLIEQCVELLEFAFPDLPIALQPFVRFGERSDLDPARPSLGGTAARNQLRTLQYLEVLGNGGLAHLERLGQLGHRGVALGKTRENRSSCGIGERREGYIQAAGRRLFITCRFHNYVVIQDAVAAVKALPPKRSAKSSHVVRALP